MNKELNTLRATRHVFLADHVLSFSAIPVKDTEAEPSCPVGVRYLLQGTSWETRWARYASIRG